VSKRSLKKRKKRKSRPTGYPEGSDSSDRDSLSKKPATAIWTS
jgi:hypothetical protein